MTEIQKTNIQFAQLQIDNMMARDKPYIQSWNSGDVGSLHNIILLSQDYSDKAFIENMLKWTGQRVQSGTGAMIEINEMNCEQLYHVFTSYIERHGLPESVVKSLGEVS